MERIAVTADPEQPLGMWVCDGMPLTGLDVSPYMVEAEVARQGKHDGRVIFPKRSHG